MTEELKLELSKYMLNQAEHDEEICMNIKKECHMENQESFWKFITLATIVSIITAAINLYYNMPQQ